MANYINIHTHNVPQSDTIKGLINWFEGVSERLFSYGIHPWDIGSTNNNIDLFDHELVRSLNCLAIGEIGLDRNIATSIKLQIEYFQAQVKIAETLNKPIIIHCVKAYSDFLQLRKQLGNDLPWIFHGFNANSTIAQKLIQNNCYLSFGKQLMHNPKLHQSLINIPIDRLFLETDDADITIQELYAFTAKLLDTEENILIMQLEKNFHQLFRRWSKPFVKHY